MDRAAWNLRYAGAPILWTVDSAPFLTGEVGGLEPGRALDLGAGEGRTALWLAQRGWRVTAVDFSDVALDRGRERADALGVGPAVEWSCADLTGFEPPPDTFDLVLLLFVHLPAADRARLLRRAAGSLVAGGTLLVVGYDRSHPGGTAGGPRDPAILFSPEDIASELGGLRVERAERLQVGDAVDAVVRAVRGPDGPPRNRWLAEAPGRSGTYDERWAALAAQGANVHGEADLVESLRPRSVLDAGCGTGRVAIELARRGLDVVGVDLDPSMLAVAGEKRPELAWVLADLASVELGRAFDAVVLAGNVMIFLEPGTEAAVVANMARHLGPGGVVVAGFSLAPGRLGLAAYDGLARAAGLVAAGRWATWDREPFAGGDYAVSVHRRPA